MKKNVPHRKPGPQAPADYSGLVGGIAELLESARHTSARAVNALMTATYWEVGRRIVEFEQGGARRAEYGEALLERLASDLTQRFGRGFARPNLIRFRQFYLAFPTASIRSTLSNESSADENPPVGLILCSGKGESVVRYATENLPSKILVREYLTILPDEKRLAAEIAAARSKLEARRG